MAIRKWMVWGAVSVAILTLVFPACGRRKAEPPKREHEKAAAAEALIKDYGLSLYPGLELLDQAVKSGRVQIPGTDKPGSTVETKVVTVVGVSGDTMEIIRAYYAKQAPNVITEEKLNEKTSFLQLSNAQDINQAIAQRVSPIILVNLRRKILSEGERLAYQNEYHELKTLKNPDLVQKRRMLELDRLLQEKIFIQINIRAQS